MKRLILVLLLAFSCLCHAQTALIDLTPGGYSPNNFPPEIDKLIDPSLHFFDEAAQGVFQLPGGRHYFNSWVSMFGELNGGQYFFTNLFVLRHPPEAQVWWNFARPNSGYSMGMLDVWGRRPSGEAWEHLYLVRGLNRFIGQGTVTLDGAAAGIWSIAFYGYER